MSLEQAISEQWALDAGLSALVPDGQLFTGGALSSPARPYVVLERVENKPVVRSSSGRTIDQAVLRFNVWSDGLDVAKQVAAEIERRFDRVSFSLAGVRCLVMQRSGDVESLEDAGAWHLAANYLVVHEPISGD